MRLPASAEPTPADVAAIERLTGTTLDVAILTAVQVERLADEIQACATDVIEEDWWVVKIQWYNYQHESTPGTPRHYKLEPGERLLAVNALLRISGVRFESGQQRGSRSGTCVLGDETHKNIQACLPYDTVGVTVRGPVQA